MCESFVKLTNIYHKFTSNSTVIKQHGLFIWQHIINNYKYTFKSDIGLYSLLCSLILKTNII
jgi:hypothetical protein